MEQTCRDPVVREDLVAYLDGELAPGSPARDRVEGHLSACAACRSEAEALRATWEIVRTEALTGVEVSADFDARLRARLGLPAAEPVANVHPAQGRVFLGWIRRHAAVALAAAAVFLLAAGLLIRAYLAEGGGSGGGGHDPRPPGIARDRTPVPTPGPTPAPAPAPSPAPAPETLLAALPEEEAQAVRDLEILEDLDLLEDLDFLEAYDPPEDPLEEAEGEEERG